MISRKIQFEFDMIRSYSIQEFEEKTNGQFEKLLKNLICEVESFGKIQKSYI